MIQAHRPLRRMTSPRRSGLMPRAVDRPLDLAGKMPARLRTVNDDSRLLYCAKSGG